MSLVKCPDCGKSMSSLAPACLNCGRPMRNASNDRSGSRPKIRCLAILAGVVVLASLGFITAFVLTGTGGSLLSGPEEADSVRDAGVG
jgi:hypothetical protein